jgi:hypothetical protein
MSRLLIGGVWGVKEMEIIRVKTSLFWLAAQSRVVCAVCVWRKIDPTAPLTLGAPSRCDTQLSAHVL